MAFANNSFDLGAKDGLGNPMTVFNLPVAVTLTYTDTDIINIPEGRLGLFGNPLQFFLPVVRR